MNKLIIFGALMLFATTQGFHSDIYCDEIEPLVCQVTRVRNYFGEKEVRDDVMEITRKFTSDNESMIKLISEDPDLKKISNLFCEKMPKLTELVVKRAFHFNFDIKNIENCTYLQKLDLSGNTFATFLPNGTFSSVTALNLSHNRIIDLDMPLILKAFPNLKAIDLSGNEFHCSRKDLIIDELKARKVKLAGKFDCYNSTEWVDTIFHSSLQPNDKLLSKAILKVIHGTEYRLKKMLDLAKAANAKLHREIELDLTRIETHFAQTSKNLNDKNDELQKSFGQFRESAIQELASLYRLLYFAYALLTAIIITYFASIFRKDCQLKKICEKSGPLMEMREQQQ